MEAKILVTELTSTSWDRDDKADAGRVEKEPEEEGAMAEEEDEVCDGGGGEEREPSKNAETCCRR
jgi:hypothetical protein